MKNLNVRMDDDLHARLKQAAERDQRSLNSEITWLLKAGLDASKPVFEAHYEYKSGKDAS